MDKAGDSLTVAASKVLVLKNDCVVVKSNLPVAKIAAIPSKT